MKAKIKIIYVLVVFQIGCTTFAPQTEALLESHPQHEVSSQVIDVPFIDQTAGHCGPATLTMVMNWAGKPVAVDDVAPQVFTPGTSGSLQLDMVSASRRQGLMAIPISGLSALVEEIRAGHPVIVFENLALRWAPQWHYAVVVGYELTKPEVILHSGHEAYSHVDLREFESSWKLGEYWGLVVLPPDQLSASADELSHVTAAVGLEQIGRQQEASQAYQKIVFRWPSSLGGLIGLANFFFSKNDGRSALKYLRLATESHPDSAPAWHNLVIVQGALLLNAAAHESALRAIELATEDVKPKYRETLKKWLR